MTQFPDDLRDSRQLALQVASYLSSDRADPDLVLANMGPVEDFLLGGDTSNHSDIVARRAAVRQHLHNLSSCVGLRAADRDRAEFMAAAAKYYDRIMPARERQG
jgi:hypothetical protein